MLIEEQRAAGDCSTRKPNASSASKGAFSILEDMNEGGQNP